ncbi:MAG: peptide-N-glycosidase [Bacteroidales bacterium]|jgi:hypothetical protein|nr:hypothetical protein [Bacteroidales bacterium]MCK9498536.1 hypothetical protein [Bacteroidales bacterium]MDY0313787.1 PNGase F N-terminal domain-containing protein [Bacteroidales bacterium]NLB86606.1 peptide-N-glycosidase [Bacteroidales bacterium]
MLKQTFLTLFVLVSLFSFSQTYQINYKSYSNGKYQEKGDFSMFFDNNIVYLSSQTDKIQQFIDFNKKENSKIMEIENCLYRNSISFTELSKPEKIENSSEKILGYNCKLAVYYSFSNKIEVWFTNTAVAYGSPYSAFIPDEKSLVLKIVINGNREIIASEIKKLKKAELPKYEYDNSVKISDSEFEEKLILSRFTRINIFENEQINFDTDIAKIDIKDAKSNHVYHLSNGGIVLKKVKIDQSLKNYYCFAELDVKSNGDAYDRTGSVFILPDNADFFPMLKAVFGDKSDLPIFKDKLGEKYQGMIAKHDFFPQIELMRFFTSFGAGHFNDLRKINNYPWSEKVTYKQEITNLIPEEENVWIGVFIGNYDKGGHIVNLKLNFYPSFEEFEENTEKFILPLFNTVNILEMSGQNYGKFFKSDTLISEFIIPENLENPILLYTSTGHGGWGEGDEFLPKRNTIFIDDEEVYNFIPWRFDCASYRFLNPASGNFSNGMSSSDLSRSNWCPGTLTNPEYIPLTNLKPGKHSIKVIINQGEDQGSSFSHWSVSGNIVGRKITKD